MRRCGDAKAKEGWNTAKPLEIGYYVSESIRRRFPLRTGDAHARHRVDLSPRMPGDARKCFLRGVWRGNENLVHTRGLGGCSEGSPLTDRNVRQ